MDGDVCMNRTKAVFDTLGARGSSDVLGVRGKLVPVSSLDPEVQYFFNVTPYAIYNKRGVRVDGHKEG